MVLGALSIGVESPAQAAWSSRPPDPSERLERPRPLVGLPAVSAEKG